MNLILKTILEWLSNALVTVLSFLAPLGGACLTLLILIITDLILAIWKAEKVGEEVTSRKMRPTYPKIGAYALILLSVHLIVSFVVKTDLPVVNVAATLMTLNELKSIDEKFKVLFGYSFYNAIKKLLSRK